MNVAAQAVELGHAHRAFPLLPEQPCPRIPGTVLRSSKNGVARAAEATAAQPRPCTIPRWINLCIHVRTDLQELATTPFKSVAGAARARLVSTRSFGSRRFARDRIQNLLPFYRARRPYVIFRHELSLCIESIAARYRIFECLLDHAPRKTRIFMPEFFV